MKSKKKIIVAIWVVLMVVLATVVSVFAVNTVKGRKEFTLEIVSDRDNYSETIECKSDKEYVGEFLRECDFIDYEESQYGMYIKGVRGCMEESKGKTKYWWFVYINGETSVNGVDKIPLEEGKKYSLVLEKGW